MEAGSRPHLGEHCAESAGGNAWERDARERAGAGVYKKKTEPDDYVSSGSVVEGGGYLLSHFRSTIGVAGFNFSVRNGKRWSPRAMATLVFLFPDTGLTSGRYGSGR